MPHAFLHLRLYSPLLRLGGVLMSLSITTINQFLPWLLWLSGLSVDFEPKGHQLDSQSRAPAWVEGQVPSRGRARGNHTLMFLSPSLSPSVPLSKNI